MRKQGMIWFVLLVLVFSVMVGCAYLPPSRPGTIYAINETEGAYGYGVLFRGHWSKDDLLAIDPATGGLMWAIQPLLKGIRIESAHGRDFPDVLRLDLIPNEGYTLYSLWTRFDGRELGESVVQFRTYIDPQRRCHVDGLGRRTCASEFVYLPRVDVTVTGPFRIHRTFYTGQGIKDLLGMP